MDLCKYKNSLGMVGEGFHMHYFGFAVGDLLLTIIASFIIMLFVKKYVNNISHSLLFGIILFILLMIAEYLHVIFCIK